MTGIWLRWVLGQWRQNRALMLWLILGLMNAAALLSAVEVLNRAARTSFAGAEQDQQDPRPWRVQSTLSGHQIPQSLWLSMRRAGIDVEPVLEGRVMLGDGQWVRVRSAGLTLLAEEGAWVTLVDRELAQRRGWQSGEVLPLPESQALPPLRLVEDLGPWLVMDMAPLSDALGSADNLTYLSLPALGMERAAWVRAALPSHLTLVPSQDPEQGSLLAALNLNLTALSALAFLVALLLAFHAFERLLHKRRRAHQTLHQLGVTRNRYQGVLLCEWSVLALLCGFAGSALGVVLAARLAPDLGETLVSLYGVRQGLVVRWHWSQGLEAALLLWLSMLAMGAFLLRLPGRGRGGAWGVLLLVLVGWLWWQASSAWQALAVCALTVLALMWLAPVLTRGLQRAAGALISRLSLDPALAWAATDQEAQRRHLSLAATAITLALAMAVATRVLVGSFEQALVDHLDQRLFADYYLAGSEPELKRWRAAFAELPPEVYVETMSRRKGQLDETPVTLVVHEVTPEPWVFLHLKSKAPEWWAGMGEGGCIVNEPLALKKGLRLGQSLTINSGQGQLSCQVQAIQYDYGNPAGQLVLQRPVLERQLGHLPLEGLALTTPENPPWVRTFLADLGVPDGAIRPQGDLRRLALTLFARTFVITDALASLTLLVAFVSWLASVASAARLWRHDHGVLLALGATPRQLLMARLWQMATLLLAILLVGILGGQVLGYQLLTLVNPLSFGWTMAVAPLSGQWWPYLLVVLLVGMALALVPALVELRKQPAGLLAQEAV
ncbi:FtsX-like permease family protein [Ferrimonas balearica]|uniref:FtsX-like permease family protein n=1 Tax=Ferrimonas balearica TaxID=44012 RepID=UPI001C99F829|nr:ABC transporter permease [Ferrimonas balearica]MBY5991624.1 ABC transporter permease [Ferrimonas balearica]